MDTSATSRTFEALARRAVLRSSVSLLDARHFVFQARLKDARSELIARRTNRAARRRAEVHGQRHPMIWAGSAA